MFVIGFLFGIILSGIVAWSVWPSEIEPDEQERGGIG
jgi:hypothetical protein